MEFLYTPEENDTWDPSTTPMQMTRIGGPTLDEICILQEFVDGYGTTSSLFALMAVTVVLSIKASALGGCCGCWD